MMRGPTISAISPGRSPARPAAPERTLFRIRRRFFSAVRPRSLIRFKRGPSYADLAVRALITVVAAISLLTGCSARQADAPPSALIARSHGSLPSSGTIVIRSGMEWMDENSSIFNSLKASLGPLLAARGLTVATGRPSTLEPMPHEPLSPKAGAGVRPAASGDVPKLARYDAPAKDADLSPSVMAVQPRDPARMLFALSQERGMPALYGSGPIPGHLPREMFSSDPAVADYTLIVRFSLLRSSMSDVIALGPLLAAGPMYGGSGGGSVVGPGGLVRGVNRMGYGAPLPPNTPPPPVYGRSPGDYARGYEGITPTPDPWHRESDFRARDYMLRYGPQPNYAQPPAAMPERPAPPYNRGYPSTPKPPLPGEPPLGAPHSGAGYYGVPGASMNETGAVGGMSYRGGGGYMVDGTGGPLPDSEPAALLEMECYSLAPMRQNNPPTTVWRASAVNSAPGGNLAAALPPAAACALKPARTK